MPSGPEPTPAELRASDAERAAVVDRLHARRERAVAVFGGVELDYRGAPFGAEPLDLQAVAVFGGVQVTVPPGVRVEMTGFSLFGGRAVHGAPGGPGAGVLRVHAVAVFGGVEVTARPR